MLKYLLPLAALAAATPVAATAQPRIEVHLGTPTPTPYNYGYSGRYHQPVFMDRYGYYRCIKPNRRVGYLMTRWGDYVTRYNFRYTYYGTPNLRLRCR